MQSKYEVIGIVGEGAYGIVYKCKNKETGDFVAIKKFKEVEDELVKKTMSRELKVLQMMKHDNIVEYKEAFKRKGNLFLVFEYVEKNLLEVLQEHPKGLDPGMIKKVIYQLCKAIKYLHDMNVVHRDIKPENLLVDVDEKLKLCDFGFARTIKATKEKLTDYVATRWYRSPELLITSGTYGSEVDYWAIGCIMGELADGDPLFPGDNELDQLNVIQKVLGKFPDYMYELFYNNPHFKRAKLQEVTKFETLERRYMGKLSKDAISFMKGLLNPDPKYRLKGEDVFNHPYFQNFPDPFPSSNNGNNWRGQNIIDFNSTVNVNSVGTANTTNNIKFKEESKKQTTQNEPIISNTTNINIINYNNFKNSDEVKTIPPKINEHLKVAEKKSPSVPNNMVLTSYNFNKNMKENILSMYGSTTLDKNFKTFYKGDPYNFDIDLNFLTKYKKQISNATNGENPQTHIYQSNDGSEYKKTFPNPGKKVSLKSDKEQSPKNKRKTIGIDSKLKQTSIIYEEPHQNNSKSVANKMPTYKMSNKGKQDFQLPTIYNKNFSLKKLVNK